MRKQQQYQQQKTPTRVRTFKCEIFSDQIKR